MSVGLIALLDDIAALAKVAAASIDDVAVQVAKAGANAAGVVIDDAAVVPHYAAGFAAARELPIIARIAAGSLRNKLLILLPASLALSLAAPWAVTPLLMLGGAYLCYEAAEKVLHLFCPDRAGAHKARLGEVALDPRALENKQVASAINTDFVLSAEIMAITLATVQEQSFIMRVLVLAIVGTGVTAAVYSVVALIVKADDIGVALASTRNKAALGHWRNVIGRGLVRGIPHLLSALTVVGTAAMLWVGGSIIGHGFEEYGLRGLGPGIERAAELGRRVIPLAAGLVGWTISATIWGIVGLLVGAALVPVVEFVLAPAWARLPRPRKGPWRKGISE